MTEPTPPCASGDVPASRPGSSRGGEGNVPSPKDQPSGWLAIGPLAQAQWVFLEPLSLEVAAGPTFRLVDERFYFKPNTTAYQVALIGVDAEIGLGVHFP